MGDIELKRKVTLKEKKGTPETNPKPKWWLWLLLLAVAIIIVIFLVKQCSFRDQEKPVQTEEIAADTPADKEELLNEDMDTTEEVEPSSTENVANSDPTPVHEPKTVSPSQSKQPETKSEVNKVPISKSNIEEKAKQTIKGNFGNGADRKRILGSEYDAIQQKVNEMYRNGEVF